MHTAVMQTQHTQEKPRRRRVKMSRTVRVRPSSASDRHFEEVRPTVSVSPDGIYFTTWQDFYYKGMQVLVTVPYSTRPDPAQCEYVGEVLGVDELGPYRRGVAIRLLKAISSFA